MKQMKFKSGAAGLLLTLMSAMLSSFVLSVGGDSYEVYLNHQLMVKEHLYGQKEVPNIPLNSTTNEDELLVSYSHCGKIGTSRKIILKDQQNAILKEWKFADSPDIKNKMTLKVSDVITFSNKHSTLNVIYSSRELPEGQLLVKLQLENTTARKK